MVNLGKDHIVIRSHNNFGDNFALGMAGVSKASMYEGS
jgi:hypothetical protein